MGSKLFLAVDCLDVVTRWGTAALYTTRGNVVLEQGGPAGENFLNYNHDAPAAFPRSAEEAGAETGVRIAGIEVSPDANLCNFA